ncbi:MAG TPA: hypothetical protein VM532_07790 [Burkholderiales bacterium]|nr:hypothetical protein [Burkholderiales bacterium]
MKETKNANYWDMTEETRARKLADAKARFGKPFITEVLVQRNTEPSFILREIERRSEEAQAVRTLPSISFKRARLSSWAPPSLCAKSSVVWEQGAPETTRSTTGSVEKNGEKKTAPPKRFGLPDLERFMSHFQLVQTR